MDTLPTELLCELYSYVSWPSVLTLPRVCKAWREMYRIPDRLWMCVDKWNSDSSLTVLIGKCPLPSINTDTLSAMVVSVDYWGWYYQRIWTRVSKGQALKLRCRFRVGRIELQLTSPIWMSQEEIDMQFCEALIADVAYEANDIYTYNLMLDKEGEFIGLNYNTGWEIKTYKKAKHNSRVCLFIILTCSGYHGAISQDVEAGSVVITEVVRYVVNKLKRLDIQWSGYRVPRRRHVPGRQG